MEKFNRSYKAVFTVGKREGLSNFIRDKDKVTTIIVTSGNYKENEQGYVIGGYSLELMIDRVAYSTTGNTGTFRFKNLPKEVQALLWLDRYQADKFVDVKLYAGYQGTQPKIFQGQITQCYSFKRGGETDTITEIEANNFTAFNECGLVNITMQGGTEFESIIKNIAEYSPDGLKAGYLTKNIPAIRKTTTYRGSALGTITADYSGFQIYIDNGLINVLDENDVIPSEVQVITAESGLLGSPRRQNSVIELETIFEPGLVVGQQVAVLSDSMSWLNQTYKIIGLTHEGTISPAECGKLITRVQLFLGTALFNELKEANYSHEQQTASGEWDYPLSKKVRVTSPFGPRTITLNGKTEKGFHHGIDLGATMGTDVLATNDGVVCHCGNMSGYGKTLMINHGKYSNLIITSLYGHLSKYFVCDGEKVAKGQVIGQSGNSGGRSTGPHLHFEMRENNSAINPTKYVTF